MAIRKSKPAVRPLYREMFRDALILAWQEKKLWFFAIFALLLQSGGLLDVLLTAVVRFPEDARLLMQQQGTGLGSAVIAHLSGLTGFQAFMGYATLAQGLLLFGIILAAVYGMSVVSQGALAYGLGTRMRGAVPSFRACLGAGARKFWPLAGINALSMLVFWAVRVVTLIAFQLAAETPTAFAIGVFTVAFICFLLAAALVTTVHLFAINRVMLNEEHAWPALLASYKMTVQSLGIVLEHAALLFLFAFTANILGIIVFLMALVPLFIGMISAALFQFGTLVLIGIFLGYALLIGIMSVIAMATTTFQYASWQRLAWRVEDASAMTKVVRIVRRLLGHRA